jgi:peptidylprolyl isomerase
MTMEHAALRRLASAAFMTGIAALTAVQVASAQQTAQAPQKKAPAAQSPQAAQTAPAQEAAARDTPAKSAPPPVTTAADNDLVVSRLGSADVKAGAVKAFVSTLSARDQAALARDQNLLNQTVRVMLTNQAVLKEALEKKWDEQPELVAQLKSARESVIVETYLQSVSVPPETYPSDTEIEALYESNKAALLVPRQFQLAQLYVSSPKTADKAAEEKAAKKLEEVGKKLKQPNADFAAVARSDSDERQSAEKGGEIGWLSEAQIRPEIRVQVLALTKGDVSDPIRTEDGWQFIKLLDTKAAYTLPLSEAREALRQRMRQERAAALRRAYMAKLIEQTPLAINELALSKVLGAPKE